MSDPAPVHHVLWTGGWDSTFRVCELLLVHGRSVQPWYVVDPERRTTPRERETMTRIRTAIVRRDPEAAARLLPTRLRDRFDIPAVPAIDEAARSIRARVRMPEQYVWIAALVATEAVEGMELALDERVATDYLVGVEVAFAPGPAPDDWTFVTAAGNPPDIVRVFGALRLPVGELTKSDMERRAVAAGFADILELTWFCRWPTILGRACGQCVPCRDVRTGGLARRVPPDTAVRRRLHRWRWDWVRRGESTRIRAGAIRNRLRAP